MEKRQLHACFTNSSITRTHRAHIYFYFIHVKQEQNQTIKLFLEISILFKFGSQIRHHISSYITWNILSVSSILEMHVFLHYCHQLLGLPVDRFYIFWQLAVKLEQYSKIYIDFFIQPPFTIWADSVFSIGRPFVEDLLNLLKAYSRSFIISTKLFATYQRSNFLISMATRKRTKHWNK